MGARKIFALQTLVLCAAGAVGSFALSSTSTPPGVAPVTEPSRKVAYVFRYSPGISQLLLQTATFSQEQPLNLDQCQVTEKINGPLGCVMNCNQMPICLLIFEGPPGLKSTDILEKVKEEPATPASPSVAPSGSFSRTDELRRQLYRGANAGG